MLCPVCQKDAEKSCSACKLVSYCSIDCQKSDWKTHKKSCCSFIVQEDESQDGKKCSLIASRDIKQGSIILDEDPSFLVPEMFDSVGFMLKNQRFLCIVCGMHLIPSTLKKCSTCGWPFCGFLCEKLSFHADNECKLFASEIPVGPYRMSEFLDIVTLARAQAVKTNNPQLWQDLMDLVDWDKVGSSYKDIIPSIVFENSESEPNRVATLPHVKSLGSEEAMDDYKRIRYLSKMKGFYLQTEEYGAIKDEYGHPIACARGGSYLYKKASRINHSCSPNCVSSVGSFPSFKVRVRAAVDIKKGQVLTVTFLHKDYEMRRGTIPRGETFFKRFGYKCHCPLCLDKTEFGSFLSAVTCTPCRQECRQDYEQKEKWWTEKYDESSHGYFLPDSPLDWSEEAPWKCNRCSRVLSQSAFRPTLNAILSEIDQQGRINCEAFFKNLIKEHRGITLHPNHWLIHFAAQGFLFRTQCGDSKKEVDKYLEQCEYILSIDDRLFPGLSNFRAWVQVHAGNIMMQRLMYPHLTTVGMEAQIREQLEDLGRCLQYQQQAYSYYKNDPPIRNGTVSFFANKLQQDMIMCKRLTTQMEMMAGPPAAADGAAVH